MTTNKTITGLRNSAAMLITASGTGQIAMLWFGELTDAAVADALLGTVYLFIGIGLLGQSRLSLFMAMAVPATAAALIVQATPVAELADLQLARVTVDVLVTIIATIVLWQVRNTPAD